MRESRKIENKTKNEHSEKKLILKVSLTVVIDLAKSFTSIRISTNFSPMIAGLTAILEMLGKQRFSNIDRVKSGAYGSILYRISFIIIL